MTAVDWIIIAFVALMALWGYAPGPRRERAVAGRLRRRRVRRQPARAAAARPGIELSLRAAVQPRDRADGRRPRGDRLRGGGSGDPAPDGVSARRTCVDGIGGARAGRDARARRWSGSRAPSRSRRRARASYRKDIQRSAILRKLNEALPPSGPILNALARADPFPRIRGPGADVPAPEPAHPARPRRAARARRASCGCSAPPAGSPCRGRGGSRRRRSWSRTPTSSPVRTTRRWSRTAATSSTRRRSSSTPTTTSPCCGSPGLGAPALEPAHAGATVGEPVAILGYPEERPLPGRARPARRDAHGDQPGRVRQRAGAAAHDLAARADPVRQLGRAGRRRRRARGRDRVRRHHVRAARRLRRAARDRAIAPCAGRREARSDTGPCVR